MTARSSDMACGGWRYGLPAHHKRPYANTLFTGKVAFLGSFMMQVDGSARPALSGADQITAAIPLVWGTGNANGGVHMTAKRPNVRAKATSGAAETITVVNTTTTIDIDITYQGTSTALTMVQAIRRHPIANQLLRVVEQGNGSGSPAAMNMTAVPSVMPLGVAPFKMDNSAGGSPLALESWIAFGNGEYQFLADANAPAAEALAYVKDDQTCSSTVDFLALRAPCRANDASGIYLDTMAME